MNQEKVLKLLEQYAKKDFRGNILEDQASYGLDWGDEEKYLHDLFLDLDGKNSRPVLYQWLGLINKISDKKIKHNVLKEVLLAYKGENDSEIEKLFEDFALDENASYQDKIGVMQKIYNPKIMESVLNMVRKDISNLFSDKDVVSADDVEDLLTTKYDNLSDIVPDEVKLNFMGMNTATVLDKYVTNYANKIKAEFGVDAILAKYKGKGDKAPVLNMTDSINVDSIRPEQIFPEEVKRPEITQVKNDSDLVQKIAELETRLLKLEEKMDKLEQDNANLRKVNALYKSTIETQKKITSDIYDSVVDNAKMIESLIKTAELNAQGK